METPSITLLNRGRIRCDPNTLIEGHKLATENDPKPVVERVETAVYNLLIEHPEGTLLWDTGSHPEAGSGHWPDAVYDEVYHYDAAERTLPAALGKAGSSIEAIDAVAMSHLHLDHAGGLRHFDGTDIPIYVHRNELNYAYFSAKTDEGSGGYIAADFDHDLNWEIIRGRRAQYFTNVEFVHLPGHTPGLMGLFVDFEESPPLLATSDLVYLQANYEEERPLGAGLLWDREAWRDSIQRAKQLEQRHGAFVLYGHDAERVEEFTDTFS